MRYGKGLRGRELRYRNRPNALPYPPPIAPPGIELRPWIKVRRSMRRALGLALLNSSGALVSSIRYKTLWRLT